MDPLVKKLETNMSKSIVRLDIRMSRLTTGAGHMYVDNRGWTYVCPSYQYTHRVGHTYVQPRSRGWTILVLPIDIDLSLDSNLESSSRAMKAMRISTRLLTLLETILTKVLIKIKVV